MPTGCDYEFGQIQTGVMNSLKRKIRWILFAKYAEEVGEATIRFVIHIGYGSTDIRERESYCANNTSSY